MLVSFLPHPGRLVSIYSCAIQLTHTGITMRPLGAKNMVGIIRDPSFYKTCLLPKPVQALPSRFKITSNIAIANPFSQEGLLLCL